MNDDCGPRKKVVVANALGWEFALVVLVLVLVLKKERCWKKLFLFSSVNSKLGSSDRGDPDEIDLGLTLTVLILVTLYP